MGEGVAPGILAKGFTFGSSDGVASLLRSGPASTTVGEGASVARLTPAQPALSASASKAARTG